MSDEELIQSIGKPGDSFYIHHNKSKRIIILLEKPRNWKVKILCGTEKLIVAVGLLWYIDDCNAPCE